MRINRKLCPRADARDVAEVYMCATLLNDSLKFRLLKNMAS